MVAQFTWDYVDSNTYVVGCGDEALIVDPTDTEAFYRYLGEQEIKSALVFLTHEHFDHISGLNKLRGMLPCEVYAHTACSDNIGNASRNMSHYANVISQFNHGLEQEAIGTRIQPFTCKPADKTFEESLKMDWMGNELLFLHTPGHSQGSSCMVLNGKYLFSGDTLLDGKAITRFPGGSKEKFQLVTMPLLERLQEKIRFVYPGHGARGSIGEMLSKNYL